MPSTAAVGNAEVNTGCLLVMPLSSREGPALTCQGPPCRMAPWGLVEPKNHFRLVLCHSVGCTDKEVGIKNENLFILHKTLGITDTT